MWEKKSLLQKNIREIIVHCESLEKRQFHEILAKIHTVEITEFYCRGFFAKISSN